MSKVVKTNAMRQLDAAKIAYTAVHVRDLLGLTGYIRGGCSPVGMKKKFPTFFDESAREWEQITVSAGVRGMVLLLNTADIVRFTDATVEDVTGT